MREPEVREVVRACARRRGGYDGTAEFVFRLLDALEVEHPDVSAHLRRHHGPMPYQRVKTWLLI